MTLRWVSTVLRRYLKTEWLKETRTVKSNVNFLYDRISFPNGVNFREFEGWIQSKNEKNIDHQSEFGEDQSI